MTAHISEADLARIQKAFGATKITFLDEDEPPPSSAPSSAPETPPGRAFPASADGADGGFPIKEPAPTLSRAERRLAEAKAVAERAAHEYLVRKVGAATAEGVTFRCEEVRDSWPWLGWEFRGAVFVDGRKAGWFSALVNADMTVRGGAYVHMDKPRAPVAPSPSKLRVRRPPPGPTEPPWTPVPPPPARPAPRFIPLDRVRTIAEDASREALAHAVPLRGATWASRCDRIDLQSKRGVLGDSALWYYLCEGRIHTGWALSGKTRDWTIEVEAETGAVIGAEVMI